MKYKKAELLVSCLSITKALIEIDIAGKLITEEIVNLSFSINFNSGITAVYSYQ